MLFRSAGGPLRRLASPVLTGRGILHILLYMSRNIALAQVRQDLSGLVDDVATTHERVVVTRHGEPAAVIVAIDDLEALEETLEILADATLVRQIERSLRTTKRYTMDEVRARLGRRAAE